MYLSNSLFIDVWSRDAGTFGYSLTRGAGYWLKLGGVGSSVRPRSLGGNITPSTGWLLCSFFSNRFSLSISHFLSSSCFSNSLFLSTSFSFSLASSCCRSNSNFLYKKKEKKKKNYSKKPYYMADLFFRSWRTLIGCWEVRKKAYRPPGAVRGQYAFFRTGNFRLILSRTDLELG